MAVDRRRAPGDGPATGRRSPLFELPDELAIDTDVAPPDHRGVHPRPARAGRLRARRCWGCPAGIDSALVAYLVAEAIGADRLLCVMMPYRTSSPASQGDAEAVIADLGCAAELVEITGMVDGYFGRDGVAGEGGPAALEAAPLRRGNFMARMRMAVLYDRSRDVAGPRRRDRQQDRVADRLHDAVRRLRVRLQPDRRPVQEPGPAAVGGHRRARGDHPQGARPRTCGRARPTRPRPASRYPELDRLLFWRIDKRRSHRGAGREGLRRGRWWSGWTGWSRAPSSSARCRRSRSSARGRRAWTTCTRGGGPGPRRGPERGRGRAPAGRCTSSRPRSGTSATSRYRALEVLRAVPLIAAEDTRITRRLLGRYEIPTRTTSYHAQSGPARERELLAHLAGGQDLALVTDAGTPVVSDPGEGLVAAWAAAGGAVVADPRGVRGARGRGVERGRRAPLVVRGVPAAERPRAAGPAGRSSPPTSGGACCSRHRRAWRPRSGTWPRPAARTGRARSAGS